MNVTSQSLKEIVGYDLRKLIEQDVIDFDLLILEETQRDTSHYELKLVMASVLKEKGFSVTAPQHELLGCLDLVAQNGEYRISGEVGVTPDSRIWNNLFNFNEVWVLPYNFGEPHTIEIYKRGKNYWNYKDFMNQHNDLMKKCPRCGRANFFSATYCSQCSYNLEKEALLCSKCGQPIPK